MLSRGQDSNLVYALRMRSNRWLSHLAGFSVFKRQRAWGVSGRPALPGPPQPL